MRGKNEKLVPVAFWIGFLMLGLVSSYGGDKRHAGGNSAQHKSASATQIKTARPLKQALPIQSRIVASDQAQDH